MTRPQRRPGMSWHRPRRFGICLSLAALLFCAGANAQQNTASQRSGPFSFSLGGGYFYFPAKARLKDNGTINVALGYRLTSKWRVAFAYGWLSTDSTATGRGTRVSYYGLENFHYFRGERAFSPYLVAGFGGMDVKHPTNNYPASSADVTVGGGAAYRLDPRIGIYADVRDLYVFTGARNHVLLNAGFSLFFG